MSVTTIAAIESTVHTTNAWIKELTDELGWEDRQPAYHAFGAVLHALRDRLTVAETADLGAQLPMLLRGLYYEGWNPGATPLRERRKEDFLRHIAAAFPGHAEIYPEEVAWAVFKVLERHVSAGEIRDILHVLPADLRSLWPQGELTKTF
jgi:uncharacterized protein (DUF2267 family)